MSGSIEFILRLVDQVSAPARSVGRSMEGIRRAAEAVGGSSRNVDGLSRAQSDLARATSGATQALGAQSARMAEVNRQMGNMARGFDQAKRGMMTGAKTALAAATGALAFYATPIAFARRELMSTQMEFERYEAILNTLTRSSEKTASALGVIEDFAQRTPYALGQVVEAFVDLSAFGVINTNEMEDAQRVMEALGDAAAAKGRQYQEVVGAVSNAIVGNTQSLRTLGIVARREGENTALEYTDSLGRTMTRIVKDGDRIGMRDALVEIFEEKYGGGMERLSNTLEGIISNIGDAWTRFKKMIIDAGVGDVIKDQLRSVLDWVDEMGKATETLTTGFRDVAFLSNDRSMFGKLSKTDMGITPMGFSLTGQGFDHATQQSMTIGASGVAGPSQLQQWAQTVSDYIVKAIEDVGRAARYAAEQLKALWDTVNGIVETPFMQRLGGWEFVLKSIVAIPFVNAAKDIAFGMGIMTWASVKLGAAFGIGALASLGLAAAIAYMVTVVARQWATLSEIWRDDTLNVFQKFHLSLNAIVNRIVDDIGAIFGVEDLSGKITAFEQAIFQRFADGWNGMWESIDAIWTVMKTNYDLLWQAMSVNIFEPVKGFIEEYVIAPIQKVMEWIDRLIAAWTRLTSTFGKSTVPGGDPFEGMGSFGWERTHPGGPPPSASPFQPPLPGERLFHEQSFQGPAVPTLRAQQASATSNSYQIKIDVDARGEDGDRIASSIENALSRRMARLNDGVGGAATV